MKRTKQILFFMTSAILFIAILFAKIEKNSEGGWEIGISHANAQNQPPQPQPNCVSGGVKGNSSNYNHYELECGNPCKGYAYYKSVTGRSACKVAITPPAFAL